MWKLASFLFACLLATSAVYGNSFNLNQIATGFPSKGFEDKIRFWQRMFTEFGDRDIVFHDREDVRLIYEVVTVERGIEEDPGAAGKQRNLLREKRAALQQVLADLAKGIDPTPRHVEVTRLLRVMGYKPSPELFERLQNNVRYQRGIREKFKAGLMRSGKYLDRMEEILQRKGVPRELAMLPHIESSFLHEARSSAGACGLWQIVRSTGNLHLTINRYVDERLDPIQSTEAAAEILRQNFDALGSWPLAITAYNYGLNGMLKAKRTLGPDLLTIINNHETKRFGFAAKNFYAEFLAAVEVHENRTEYFGSLTLEPPLRFQVLRLPRSLRVTELTGPGAVTLEELRSYNPALTRRTWERGILPSGFDLRIPETSKATIARVLEKGPAPSSSADPESESRETYRVQRGDSLISIANRMGTTVEALQAANGIRDTNRIYAGQGLVIPQDSDAGKPVKYRVQRGDTVLAIAKRFGRSPDSILQANQIQNPDHIVPGQTLFIP